MQESTIEAAKGTTRQQKGRTDFQVHRVISHFLKEQGNHVVGVEGQVLTAKLSAQPENPLVTSVESLDTSNQFVEVHLKGQGLEKWRQTALISWVLFIPAMCQQWK